MVYRRGKPKNSEETLLQCYFVHHNSHLKSPGIEAGSQLWKASVYPPELCHGHFSCLKLKAYLKADCKCVCVSPVICIV
jgi:hypothetical protein